MTLLPAQRANGNSRLVLQSWEIHRAQVGGPAEFRDLAQTQYRRPANGAVQSVQAGGAIGLRPRGRRRVGRPAGAGPSRRTATSPRAGGAAIRPFRKGPMGEEHIEGAIEGAYVVPGCEVTEPSSRAEDEELQRRLYDLTVDVLVELFGRLAVPEVAGVRR